MGELGGEEGFGEEEGVGVVGLVRGKWGDEGV